MSSLSNETAFAPRSSRKPKRKPKRKLKRVLSIIGVIFLLVLIGGGSFLYGTDQGLQMRRMLLGTAFSTYHHPELQKFMELFLPKSEIDKLYATRNDPQTYAKQSKVGKVVKSTQVKASGKSKLNKAVEVKTVETANYTAKIMVIPDPTTVHVVGTKYADKGQALSELINENHAVAGINAGGFYDPSGRGSGGQMTGIVLGSGKVLSTPGGNRDAAALVAAFRKDGEFITGNYSVNQLVSLGVTDAISFGPQLIVDGKNLVTSSVDAAWGWAPRTALGQAKDGSIIMIITDGRFYWNKTHRGASMSDIARLFEKYNVTNAIAMDGGGSTTMIKDGALQLKPATNTRVGMRYLPNAWVVIPK